MSFTKKSLSPASDTSRNTSVNEENTFFSFVVTDGIRLTLADVHPWEKNEQMEKLCMIKLAAWLS